MMLFSDLLELLNRATLGVWVAVARVQGSVPREEDAGMVITHDRVHGTIGGGHLELNAIELAREWLRLGKTEATQRHYPLGPALGQCCGGAVDLLFRPVTEAEREWVEVLAAAERDGGEIGLATQLDQTSPHTALTDATGVTPPSHVVTHHRFNPWQVWIFGAGHVGKALAQVLGTLPCVITWVDSRDVEFPVVVPDNLRIVLSDHPVDEVSDIPRGADVLVLTHSHALDLDIVMQLVRRDDLAYVGVIGSETKARLFRRRLEERGLDAQKMVCPIGVPAGVPVSLPAGMAQRGVKNKHPGAIALAVAADLLARRDASAHSANQANQANQANRANHAAAHV